MMGRVITCLYHFTVPIVEERVVQMFKLHIIPARFMAVLFSTILCTYVLLSRQLACDVVVSETIFCSCDHFCVTALMLR